MSGPKCPRCGGAVRITAIKCEFCGKRLRYATNEKAGFLIIGLFVVFFVLYAVFSTSSRTPVSQQSRLTADNAGSRTTKPSTSSREPSASVGTNTHISGSSWYGCIDRRYFKKLTEYAVDRDEEAFKTALTAGLLSGACTLFRDGEIVYITDTAVLSGLVKVRRKGETEEYWTNIEAIR